MDSVKTGALIALMRKERELTQKNLAERLHVSTQAVSKWERGLSCPDISLLEPLAEVLGLTVTELLSGQRGEQPKEELVRDSLHFGLSQLGPQIRQWKWLFFLAVAVLAAVLAGMGYLWVRDNTEWLPQRETVVRELRPSDSERKIADALSKTSPILMLYEFTLADDVEECTVQAELWAHGGLEQSWILLECGKGIRTIDGLEQSWTSMWSGPEQGMTPLSLVPRRQLLVLSVNHHSEKWSEEEQRWTEMWFECGTSFVGYSGQRTIESISTPYDNRGVSWGPSTYESRIVDREEGTVLLALCIGCPNGVMHAPSSLPSEHEEDVHLVIRMLCK